jgi:hypothetical protein
LSASSAPAQKPDEYARRRIEDRPRVGFEVGVGEVGDFSGMAMELDQVGAVELAEVGAGEVSD